MKQSKKDEIGKDIELAGRLNQLRHQPGWKDIEAYLSGQYQDALAHLVSTDNELARTRLQVIENLVDWMRDSKDFGKEQLEKYKDRLFGQNPSEDKA